MTPRLLLVPQEWCKVYHGNMYKKMIKSLLKNYITTVREIIMQASTNSVDFEFKKS